MKIRLSLVLCLLLTTSVQARVFHVIDQYGFERPMSAMTLELPDDWSLQSDIRWGANPCGMYLWHVLAQSGDTQARLEGLPAFHFTGSTDPMTQSSIATVIAQQAQLTGQSPYCQAVLIYSIEGFLNDYFIPLFRPGAELVQFVPDAAASANTRQQTLQSLAGMQGMLQELNVEVARVRLDYPDQGEGVAEWIYIQLVAKEYAMMPYVDTEVAILSLRAPVRQIDRYLEVLNRAIETSKPNPQWQARVAQVRNQVGQTAVREAGKRSRIISESNNQIGDMIMQGWQQRQQTLDNVYDRGARARQGIGRYTDPIGGTGYDAEYGHERIWVNPYGEYVPGNDPYYDPNLDSDTQWLPAEPDAYDYPHVR
jgi:hypothetical protein